MQLTLFGASPKTSPDGSPCETTGSVPSLARLLEGGGALRPPGGKWRTAGVVVGPKRVAAWRVLDAQHFGVPQRRRRVFIVAGRVGSGADPVAVLFEPKGVRGDIAARGSTRQEVAGQSGCDTEAGGGDGNNRVVTAITAKIAKRTGDPSGDEAQHLIADTISDHEAKTWTHEGNNFRLRNVIPFDPVQATSPENRSRFDPGAPVHALARDNAARASIASSMCVRRLTVRECERLQGFPDDHTLVQYRRKIAADAPRYRAIGNSMAVPVVRWLCRRLQSAHEKLPRE